MKKKIFKFIKSFKMIILITFLAFLYFTLIASSRYESTAIIGVKSTNTAADTSSLIPIIGLTSSSKEDIMYLKEYINSYDMLNILQSKINIKSMYNKNIDYELLYNDLDTKEGFLNYYQQRIDISYDDITGLLTIKTQAFNQENAKLIADTILKESENFINEISHKIAREQMEFANNELQKIQNKLNEAQNEIMIFQNKNAVLDPLTQAQAQVGIANQIQSKIIEKEVELSTLESYLNPNTPQVKALKSEINALKAQLNNEKNKLTSSDNKEKLNNLAIDFANLQFKLKFAEDAYKIALTTYEKARLDATKKLKQLVIISSPTIPTKSIYPNIFFDTLSVFLILGLIFGIAKFTYSIIEEHRY